jgi:hypothetical protein
MTELRFDDARITAGQATKAGEAVALIEGLLDAPITVNAVNLTEKVQLNRLSNKWFELQQFVIDRQMIVDWCGVAKS